jgi:hypothetical protein
VKRQFYNLVDEDADLGGTVELRIHGMGGQTPEEQLEDPHPVQIGGDRIAGFFRNDKVSDHHLEGYSWGGLTSRDSVRALWVILLPFALANVAGYLMPRGGGGRHARYRRAIHAIVRLLSLTATLVLLAWVAAIAVDHFAYQCGGKEACRSGRWWLAVFGHPTFGSDQPGRRLVVGALVPLALLSVLWFLSYRSWKRYETVAAEGVPSAERVDLAQDSFWRGEELVRRLRTLHVAGGIGLLAFALGYAVRSLSTPIPGRVAAHPVWVVPLIEVGVVAALALLFRGVGFRLLARRAARLVLLAVPAFTLVWTAVVAWTATSLQEVASDVAQPLPRLAGWFRLLFDVAFVLFLALAVVLVAMRLGPQPEDDSEVSRRRPGFFGFGPLIIAVLAFTLLSAILNGTSVVVANVLGEPVPYGQSALGEITAPQVSTTQPQIAYPQLYDLFSVGFSLGFLVLVVGLLIWWLRERRRARREIEAIRGEYDKLDRGPYPFGDDRAWCLRVARGRATARMVDRADVPLTLAMVLALLLQTVGSVLIHTGRGVGRIWETGPFESFTGWGAVRQVSVWFVSLIPIGLVLVTRRSFSDRGWRRRLGILWDLLTFWPRAFHPLAPPCYAERAVPDLKHRVRRILGANGRVLLSGHSQGSVMAVATVLQLDEQERRGLMLLTHGSPVGRLYRRFFPDYFGDGVNIGAGRHISEGTAGGSPRWLNLHRLTDYIGGPIFTEDDSVPAELEGRVEDLLLDDPERRKHPAGEPAPGMRAHSDYLSQTAAKERLTRMLQQLEVESQAPAPAEAVVQPESAGNPPRP